MIKKIYLIISKIIVQMILNIKIEIIKMIQKKKKKKKINIIQIKV